ncbi:large conductance mechanosensitive channel protein MscL [Planctomonas psychrotolerans]|uniref:large conductance mechanosensitive channel protein MscL n=1 Tax=Planctomonas psychrotolerans TaxID=2528712 RepID=UPI00123BF5C0|nr:large conductance mechanosensitive channel protein MscL [Planctomonas psychrotolerans]
MKGFKEFILRGNVIDLAVAVVIGAAFTAIVNSLVENIFNPAIGALFRAESLDALWVLRVPALTDGAFAEIRFGAVVGAVLQFLIIAAVVYFVLVLPINHLQKVAFARQKAEAEATPEQLPPTEAELLIEIRDLLAGRPSPEGNHSQPERTVQVERTAPIDRTPGGPAL